MNFYIANSYNEVNPTSKNVYFDEDLMDFIYDNRIRLNYILNLRLLTNIDSYSNELIQNTNLSGIKTICEQILKSGILENYTTPIDAKKTFVDLISLIDTAIQHKSNIVSVGD